MVGITPWTVQHVRTCCPHSAELTIAVSKVREQAPHDARILQLVSVQASSLEPRRREEMLLGVLGKRFQAVRAHPREVRYTQADRGSQVPCRTSFHLGRQRRLRKVEVRRTCTSARGPGRHMCIPRLGPSEGLKPSLLRRCFQQEHEGMSISRGPDTG